MNRIHRNQEGMTLTVVIIIASFMIAVGIAVSQANLNNLVVIRDYQRAQGAQEAADAGLEYALAELNDDSTYTGTSDYDLFSNSRRELTFDVTVTGTGTSRVVDATGYLYDPGVADPVETRKSRMHLEATPTSSGDYGVAAGVGGVKLDNSARVIGNVYSDGPLDMSNSSQIGTVLTPVVVEVANKVCPSPADSYYPRLCTAGENDNPISLINSAHIYADVSANHQSDGSDMSNGGLVASSGVEPRSLPNLDRAGQIAAANPAISGPLLGSCSSGVKIWDANTRFSGDVNVSGTCVVTVLGDIWIEGSLTISNSASLVVAPGLLEPVSIMIDGSNGLVAQNSSRILANPTGIGMHVVTYYSEASCSPNCTNVIGTDLEDSQSQTTIDLKNSLLAQNSFFMARWTKIIQDNSASAGALAGQTVEIKNSATVSLGTAVPSFGDTLTWRAVEYQRVSN